MKHPKRYLKKLIFVMAISMTVGKHQSCTCQLNNPEFTSKHITNLWSGPQATPNILFHFSIKTCKQKLLAILNFFT